jgi:hypothetical protein
VHIALGRALSHHATLTANHEPTRQPYDTFAFPYVGTGTSDFYCPFQVEIPTHGYSTQVTYGQESDVDTTRDAAVVFLELFRMQSMVIRPKSHGQESDVDTTRDAAVVFLELYRVHQCRIIKTNILHQNNWCILNHIK